MSERDADFSPQVKEIIAARAGYRCSYPGCDETTIGPGAGVNDIERKGVAAHIFAASEGPNAPRGTGGLSAEQRSRPENGIWLCRDHAWLGDYERGKNYPASMLQAWKAGQEIRITRELQKCSSSQFCWMQKITLEANPLFQTGSSLDLGKVTLIVGNNESGKSALCEWLSGACGFGSDLRRWGKTWTEQAGVNLRIELFTPSQTELAMKFKDYSLDIEYAGKKALDVSHAIRVLYLKDRLRRLEFEDDLEYLARVWRIHFHQVFGVISQISSTKYGAIRFAELKPEETSEDEEPKVIPEEVKRARDGRPPQVLWSKIDDHENSICFDGLSGSEQGQILISGAMIIANHYSVLQGALLLLDLGQNFDDALLSFYAERLQSSDFNFQTILVAPSERPDVNWTGWSIARLIKEGGQRVRISQNTIGNE